MENIQNSQFISRVKPSYCEVTALPTRLQSPSLWNICTAILQQGSKSKFLLKDPVAGQFQWEPLMYLRNLGFIWLIPLSSLQQHVVVDKWQNAVANLFRVSVPRVLPLPSVWHCHMTGRCVAVINPQITTHWETEFCHSSSQTEQREKERERSCNVLSLVWLPNGCCATRESLNHFLFVY